MNTLKVTRKEFLEIYAGIKVIEKKGKVKSKEWMKIMDSRISLDGDAKKHDEGLKAIKEKTGYDKLEEAIKQASMKGEISETEPYKFSEAELKAETDFNKLKDEYLDSEISIKVNMIPEEVIDKLPNEVLEFRGFVWKLIQFKDSKSNKKESASA